MSSRYVANDAYDQLAITIGASEDSIRYTYLTQEDEVVQERIEQYNKVAITNMMIDGSSVDAIPLHFVPYHVGCTIGEDESAMSKKATFEVSSTRSNKKFCFEIDSSSCKILSYLCLDEDNIRYYGN
jgi:hypothetical protein